jgi:hypothetical protein
MSCSCFTVSFVICVFAFCSLSHSALIKLSCCLSSDASLLSCCSFLRLSCQNSLTDRTCHRLIGLVGWKRLGESEEL